MKNLPHIVFLTAIFVAFSCSFLFPRHAVSAQAVGNISANALSALKIHGAAPLNFGYVQGGPRGGSVRLLPTGGISPAAGRRSATGDVRAPRGLDHHLAAFFVAGDAGKTYFIFLPSDVTAVRDQGRMPGGGLRVENLSAYSITKRAVGDMGQLDAKGRDTLYVGGDLIVPPGAPSGVYRADFDVTVAYP
ncbi:MAG: DUF4402 domain-containing protein [Rickettsiales bacterium]